MCTCTYLTRDDIDVEEENTLEIRLSSQGTPRVRLFNNASYFKVIVRLSLVGICLVLISQLNKCHIVPHCRGVVLIPQSKSKIITCL